MWNDPDDYRRIGAVMADHRKQLGMTQVDLASRLGKPQSFVSSYESGQRRLDLAEFIRITGIMGLSAERLFSEIVAALSAD